MRNWPYAWSLGQAADSPIKDKIGVAALPEGGADGKPSGALGGWQLAVSRYSANPDAAVDLVALPDLGRRAEAPRDRRRLQPDHREPLPGPGDPGRDAVLRLALRRVRQRGGAAVAGDRRQVQPGQLRVLQRGARGAERQGRGAGQPGRPRAASSTGCRAAGAGSRARQPARGGRHGSDRCRRRRSRCRGRAGFAPHAAAHAGRLAVRGADAGGAGRGCGLAAPAHHLVRVHRRQPRRPVRRPSSSASPTSTTC